MSPQGFRATGRFLMKIMDDEPEMNQIGGTLMSATHTEHHPLKAVAKTRSGKGAARELRRQGYVPAVVYGLNKAPEHYGVFLKDIHKALRIGHFYTHTQEIVVDGKPLKVLAKSIQRDPVNDEPIHIDFLRYNPSSLVHINVMVRLEGEADSPGLKEGGVMQLIETDIEVVCRADSIPEEIVVNVAELHIGESIHLSSLKLPEGVKPAVTDRDLTIASIISTRTSTMAELDAAAEAEAAAAAPSAEVPATAQKGEAKPAEAEEKK